MVSVCTASSDSSPKKLVALTVMQYVAASSPDSTLWPNLSVVSLQPHAPGAWASGCCVHGLVMGTARVKWCTPADALCWGGSWYRRANSWMGSAH